MRLVQRVEVEEPRKLDRKRVSEFNTWLTLEITDSMSAAAGREKKYKHLIDLYSGKPQNEWSMDAVPVQQVEVTLGAISADNLAAQAHATIFGANPLVSVRGNDGAEQAAKHFQTLINHLALEPFVNLKPAADELILDTTQLGTGALYTVWADDIKNTGIAQLVGRGPRIYSVAPDNLIVPGGASTTDVDLLRFVGYRSYYDQFEMAQREHELGWDISKALETQATGVVQRERDRTTEDRNTDKARLKVYEILHVFCEYDIDGDGVKEDLYVVYDRTSQQCLKIDYNGFDSRPFSIARYQIIPHKFFGLGVLEMIMPYQQAATDWYNFNVANAKLANSRFVVVKWGSPLAGSKLRLMPNKPLYVNNVEDISFTQAAELYPSSVQRELLNWQLADKRTGIQNAMGSGPAPGKRTPATTAMTIIQQMNQRFTPAFDSIRGTMADALVQACLRMQEKYQTDDSARDYLRSYWTKLLGPRGAAQIAKIMEDPTRDIRDALVIEMTAATQSINREADRQSSTMMMQMLGQYYQRMIQMSALAASPQAPPGVKAMIEKIAKANTEAMDRFLRTFDQVRDPSLFLIDEDEFAGLFANTVGPNGLPEGANPNAQPGAMAGAPAGPQPSGEPLGVAQLAPPEGIGAPVLG